MLRLIALALALALAACSLPTVDKDADAAARGLYDEIRTGADISKDPRLGAELRNPEALAQLAEVRAHIPTAAPTKVENRSYEFNTTTSGSTASLTHAYEYPGGTVLADTTLQKAPGQKTWSIVGFHVKVEPKSGRNAPAATTTPPGEKT
jgi:hypothetical protein